MKVYHSIKTLLLFSLLLLFLTINSNAQIVDNNDSSINVVIDKQIRINQKKQSMPGYRVQIYVGGKRDKANEIKSSFNNSFPAITAYIAYQQPNFKVRVGDCKTRLEALNILEQIKAHYEVAFVVKDEVKLPSID